MYTIVSRAFAETIFKKKYSQTLDANLISLRQQATITAEDSAGSKERKMGMELGKRKKKRENGKEVGQDERGCDRLTWRGDVKLAGKRPLDRLFGFTQNA